VDALLACGIPKNDYEIIIVNNGSTDRTFRIATSYDVRVLGTRKKVGHFEAMDIGAKNANYNNLLFIDQRTLVKKDTLKNIETLNYSPIVSGELNLDKYRSGHDTFMYLIYSKLYSPHFPQSRFGSELWISKQNFRKVLKNKALLYIEKDLFNKLVEDGFDFNNGHEDFLRKIVYEQNYRILSHTDVNVEYVGDLKVKTNREIVENGFKWGKRYLKRFNVYSFLYYSIHISVIALVAVYMKYSFLAMILVYLLFLIYLADSKKDFWILLKSAPGEILRFYIGTIKYLTSKK
jgi:glycosyltransferase involved in cell wall biosynthesis